MSCSHRVGSGICALCVLVARPPCTKEKRFTLRVVRVVRGSERGVGAVLVLGTRGSRRLNCTARVQRTYLNTPVGGKAKGLPGL